MASIDSNNKDNIATIGANPQAAPQSSNMEVEQNQTISGNSGMEIENADSVNESQLNALQKLRTEAIEFKQMWLKFNAEFDKSETMLYYLFPAEWVRTWKKHVGYSDTNSEGFQPNYKYFSKLEDTLNNYSTNDLVDETPKDGYFPSNVLVSSKQGLEIHLKPDLKEEQDYIIINEEIIEFFNSKYPVFKLGVPRRAYRTPSGSKAIQINYKQVSVVILNLNTLKSIDQKELKQLTARKLQIFSHGTQEEFKKFLAPIAKEYQQKATLYQTQTEVTESTLRLWKLGDQQTLQTLYSTLLKSTNNHTSFDYSFKVPLPFIERTDAPQSIVGEILGIEEENKDQEVTLIIEVQKSNGKWAFKLEGSAKEEMCEFCRQYEVLTVECRCKSVKYCTELCKKKDEHYHNRNCDFAGIDSDDETDTPYEFTNASVRGVCGLQNLGNTCFLNSALQCLSHSLPLTKYFLDKRFKPEINQVNVLGTKGKLVKAYARFIKNVWVKSSQVFSPSELKLAIARVQSMFSGYQQHDSQEFLSYMLDAIHEDVNRVLVKQSTESIDSNGRDDKIVSKESWLNHMKRNESIIVDLMQGQYKSKVTCPDCSKQSITFDPFLTCSIPIPITEIKKFSAYLIPLNNKSLPVEITYSYDPNDKPTVEKFKEFAAEKYALSVKNLDLYYLTDELLKERYSNKQILEHIRESMKEYRTKAVLVEHPSDFIREDNTFEEIAVKFSHLEEYGFTYKKTRKQTITFVRPILVPKETNVEGIHLAIFNYLKLVFLRNQAPNSDYSNDASTMSDQDLLSKYVLSVSDDSAPYKVYLDKSSDPQQNAYRFSYNDESMDDNVVLDLKDQSTLSELKAISKGKHLKVDVIVNKENELGKSCKDLHSLDKTADNNIAPSINKEIVKDEVATIQDCLKLFQKPEELEEGNEWYCSQCKEHKKAIKEMRIYRAPEILIIHLKRFKGQGYNKSKLGKMVDFPLEGLDMTEFVVEQELPLEYLKDMDIEAAAPTESKPEANGKNGKLLYDLYAVTNHFGGLGGGHYTAYAKNKDQWYCFDDSHVSKTGPQDVPSTASYILFYQRRSQ